MFQELGLIPMSSTATDGPQSAIGALQRGLNLFGTSSYILRTFFPGVLHGVLSNPWLLNAMRVLIGVYLATKAVSGGLSGLIGYIVSLFVCSVSLSVTNTPYYDLQHFLATKKTLKLTESLLGETSRQMLWKDRDPRLYQRHGMSSETLLLVEEPRLEIFRHAGRFFTVTLKASVSMSTATIWTRGRSSAPITDLMDDAYRHADSTDERTTKLCISNPGGNYPWMFQWRRPARPIDTVNLESAQKQLLIEDVGEFRTDETRDWYRHRSIPYRRGYLFHGPPGTGKSSLAFALAGHFKLSLYALSLLDSDLSDSKLSWVMGRLPKRSLLLLEDIDSAGMGREAGENGKEQEKDKKKDADKSRKVASKVTLSGLLNAIDGPHAPEGHVLVMTTNTPEDLDEALVRPGRIDMQVEFKHAARSQIRDMFFRMYSEDTTTIGEGENTIFAEDLKTLADAFADKVPEDEFSPAQFQEFLVPRKKNPKGAVEEVDKWVKQLGTTWSEGSCCGRG